MGKSSRKGSSKRRTSVIKKKSKNVPQNEKSAKNRKKQAQRSKTLLRQIRGVKWDETEYDEEIDELDDLE